MKNIHYIIGKPWDKPLESEPDRELDDLWKYKYRRMLADWEKPTGDPGWAEAVRRFVPSVHESSDA